MALSLLDRVKNKALEALQGVGNFVSNEFNKQPIVQNINAIRQAAPQIQRQISSSPQVKDFQDVLSQFSNTIGNQPIINNPNPYLKMPEGIPTVGEVIPPFWQVPLRKLEQIRQTQVDPFFPTQKPVGAGKILFGEEPIQNFPSQTGELFQKAKDTGIPAPVAAIGAPLAVGAVSILDLLPAGGGKKSIANIASKSKTVEQFANAISRDKNLLAQVETVIKDTKNSLNTIEDVYASLKPAAKKTEELFQGAAKGVGETVQKVVDDAGNPFKTGDIYKKKNLAQKIFEDAFRSSKGVIAKSGEAGKEIVRRLDASDQEAATLAGEATAKLQAVLKNLKGPEVDTFADVAQGLAKPISEAQDLAVKTWRSIADDVATKAKSKNIEMGIRENYFPHQTLELSKADKLVFAQKMVKDGKYATEAEALQAIERETAGSIAREAERRFGSFLPRETDLPYNKSPNVLFDYIENAYGKIADVGHFGANDEELYKLAQAAGTQGGDANQIVKYLDQILRKNQTPNKLAQALTSLQTITKLSPVTSAINLTQNLSTWLRTDTRTMAATMKDIVKNSDEAFANAVKVGEISPSMARELQDYIGTGKAATKWIRLIGMQGTEKFNRIVAVNAGIKYGTKLAKQAEAGSGAAIRELERFGIKLNEIKNGVLSDAALKKIGRQVSGETQFSTKAGELPYYWRTNIGKVVTQFKSFAYKQTGFVADTAKRTGSELKAGNPKPLINMLIVGGVAAPIAGEIVNDFRSLIRNKKREDVDTLTERYISNILAATSFGLLDSTSALFGEYGAGGIISTVGGPSVSDVQKIATAGLDAFEGASDYDTDKSLKENLDPKNTTTRNLIKEIPAVGQTIANTVVPNAFIDNYIGVNNGLNKSDNETYKKMKESNPSGAEEFKRNNQYADQADDSKNIVDVLFGGGKKAQGESDEITWKNDDGYDVTVNLTQKDFSGKKGIAGFKQDTSNASKAVKLWGAPNDQVPDEVKIKAYEKLGFKPDDVRYAYKADFTVDEKTEYIKAQDLEHDKLIQQLTTGRVESIKGVYFASNGVLDNLYEEGLISDAERDYLKKVKIGKDGKISTSTLKAVGGKGKALTPAKIKSYINSLNSLFKDPINAQPKQVTAKKVKSPTFASAKQPNQSGPRRSKDQWFNAY